ncbi:MAG TPA: hypothetical protein VJH88_03015 [Candidatus Nanoarchaeia archaeon]|nr:hypothetical protein [Candidatus Nanoarchaeia archaeon]
MTNTKALEYIATELIGQGMTLEQARERIHQASFLATLEAATKVIGPRVTPTPLFRIAYDEVTHQLDLRFLEGKGKVPRRGAIDIEFADFMYASLACERVSMLSEGLTGTGKTFTLEKVVATVFPAENYRVLRLNPNMSNVDQPYINGRIDSGVLQISINHGAARSVAVLITDEQNRGDTNSILAKLDGQVILATGERTELGLPIPTVSEKEGAITISYDGKVRPVVVHGAQNPATAQYTGARSTDSAVGNRQINIDFPNMALHSGAATVNMGGRNAAPHSEFKREFVVRLARYLGVDGTQLGSHLLPGAQTAEEKGRADGEYLSLHAFSFDPEFTRTTVLKSAVELADHIIMMTGGKGLASNFADELQVAQDWTYNLSKYGANFIYQQTFDGAAEVVRRLDGLRSSMKEELIERDKSKAMRVADALALITRYKTAYAVACEKRVSPLESFADKKPLTVRDVAGAYTFVLNDKKANGGSPVTLVDQAFRDYESVVTQVLKTVYQRADLLFDINDRNASIRNLVAYKAINDINKVKNGTGDEYATAIIGGLNKLAQVVRGFDNGDEPRKLLIARVNADIATLAGFVDERRHEIAESMNATVHTKDRYDALAQIVRKAREEVKTNYTLPRVERIFGI